MKALVIALFAASMTLATVSANAASCSTQATEKKLAGAAKTSFMQKCERDAGTACDAQAAEKKLKGAAKASFTKKCKADAVGN
jgi:hypothetical protein